MSTKNVYFVIFNFLIITSYTFGINCYRKCMCHENVISCSGLDQKEFESDDFQNTITQTLEKIRIYDGIIPELQMDIFGKCNGDSSYRLDKLVKLDLHNNQITEIHWKTFHCMPNLEELNLANNQWNISKLHTGIFTSIPNLKKLNLSNAFHDDFGDTQHIMQLQEVFLQSGLIKLEVLSLDKNRFTVFDAGSAGAICTFPALKRLNLANNILPKVRLYHVRCTPHLEYLDLSYNDIINFDDYSHNGLLYSLDQIQLTSPKLTVNFVENEFNCDCELLEFHNWLKRTKVYVIKKTKLRCHDGFHFNHSITSLKTDEFKCVTFKSRIPRTSSHRAIIIGVLITMLVLIGLFLIVVAYLKRDSIRHFARPGFRYKNVNNEKCTRY